MPRACSVCTHPDLAALDEELAAGASLRYIAGRFGTSKSAVERHRTDQHTAAPVLVNVMVAEPEPPPPAVSGQEDGILLVVGKTGGDDAAASASPVAETAPTSADSDALVSTATYAEIAPRIATVAGRQPSHNVAPCPECREPMELAGCINVHKIGTGWCTTHGRIPPAATDCPANGWPWIWC